MIITRRKELQQILDSVKGKKKIYLIGCTLCATVCKTGGEAELEEMKKKLASHGKTVIGEEILDPACNLLECKRLSRREAKKISQADVILSLACGGGTQAIAEIFKDKKVCPANDTIFQGEITSLTLKKSRFEQKCSLCGECVLAETGGICPVTLCPKGLVNGPCGGMKNKKCEVSDELDCVWILIYERLKKLGELKNLKRIKPIRDNSVNRKPQTFETK
ncbi:MAG: methylenetetrahydrofolate reductase C-terminal domain-containing protein [Candidatus Omnitrophica bacterium]|nr:methylenetetrahydrofolate reductase C-terminal domain-containing protein [Candidatus Omnitrophota bacterium]